MIKTIIPGRLWQKALLLLAIIAVMVIVEVSTALHFKKSLETDFNKISKVVRLERDYLFGLMISADLVYDISAQSNDPEKFSAERLLRNLYQISNLQQRIITGISGENSVLNIQSQIFKLQNFKPKVANSAQVLKLKRGMVKQVNLFSKELHIGAFKLTNQRRRLIKQYNEKSDFSAWLLLAIGFAGFALICIVSGGFLTRLVKSLSHLEKRAKQISEGNYGERLEIEGEDEIGKLVASINTMASSLEQREDEVAESRSRLLQQEKMFTIGTFAAGIAHEVGNPIQAISALASHVSDSLSARPQDDEIEKNIECIDMIVAQTERLDKVLREVREFNYSGSVEKIHCNLNDVVLNTVRMMRYDHRFREIDVTTNLLEHPPLINVVPDHFTQVLMNLLINAADAIEEKLGMIVISTQVRDDQLELSVADNGCGMPEENLDKVVEPFFTTKQVGKGTGLGLAICKQIAQEHNGDLTIESDVGYGTKILLHVPVVSDEGLLGEGI